MSRAIQSHFLAFLFPALVLLIGTEQSQAQCRAGQQSRTPQQSTMLTGRVQQPPGLISLQQQQLMLLTARQNLLTTQLNQLTPQTGLLIALRLQQQYPLLTTSQQQLLATLLQLLQQQSDTLNSQQQQQLDALLAWQQQQNAVAVQLRAQLAGGR